MMKFTADRYKLNECILFGDAAQDFVSQAKYGYVVALLEPRNIEKESNKPWVLTVKDKTRLFIIGLAKDYGVCDDKLWAEFLNKSRHSKCLLHTHIHHDLVFQNIKSQRPNLRGNRIESEKIKKLHSIRKQMETRDIWLGFKQSSITEDDHMVPEKEKKK